MAITKERYIQIASDAYDCLRRPDILAEAQTRYRQHPIKQTVDDTTKALRTLVVEGYDSKMVGMANLGSPLIASLTSSLHLYRDMVMAHVLCAVVLEELFPDEDNPDVLNVVMNTCIRAAFYAISWANFDLARDSMRHLENEHGADFDKGKTMNPNAAGVAPTFAFQDRTRARPPSGKVV